MFTFRIYFRKVGYYVNSITWEYSESLAGYYTGNHDFLFENSDTKLKK